MPAAAKFIIFTERIGTSAIIYNKLNAHTTGLYHSGMPANVRANALHRFEDEETRVLVSCRALDEGFNVPEADIGIIVSCTNNDRRRVQRLERVAA